MHLFPLFHGLLAFLLTKAYGVPIGDSIRCAKAFYGSPSRAQCDMMLESFASNIDHLPRYFDEEQVRADGLNWPGVFNNYPTEVVQLPGYWSSGTCNIGLFGDHVSTPGPGTAGLSSWRNVRVAGIELLNRCLVGGVGGSVHVKSYDGRYIAASIVMWESGSYFDFMSNEIQNSPLTIRPSLTGLLNGTISMSAINATLGLSTTPVASVKLPWNVTATSRQ